MRRGIIRSAEQELLRADDTARRLFEPYTKSRPMRAVDLLSKAGDQPEVRLVSCALIAAGTLLNNDRLVRAGARMIIAHEAATLTKDLVKSQIDRVRPRSAASRKQKVPKKGNHTAKEKTSFPSGHSAGAIAAARAFAREFPEYAAPSIGAASVIAVAQVLRCAHYPSDVLAGLAIGLAAEAVTDAGWNAANMDERSGL